MKTPTVRHLLTPAGNPAKNQFVIMEEGGAETFQSYHTLIARKIGGGTYLAPNWDYSNTTRRYLYQFLGVANKAEVYAKIKSGEYVISRLQ